MKKIININLSGRVIPIEDSAYEKLKSYIESLRRYFSKEEDRDEIINDIESRIAELMSEKIRKGAASITDADIDEIAASMGRPEDFEAAGDETAAAQPAGTGSSSSSRSERRSRGRLYRDTSDKFIGGVCSGIAAYLNVDPAIVRILFAIITFGGFGIGFLAYIVLWIVLPAKDVEHTLTKRLYRNPEDRVIGGVAGGLAAYFHRETWVIRLTFAAPFLFSLFIGLLRGLTFHHHFDVFPNIVFGSLTSTFIITYIILWIVLPEARSTHEKMEMRGEKVDVNTIAQNMKDRVKEWSEEVKESAQNFGSRAKEFANTKGKTFVSEVGDTTRRNRSGCVHAIGVLFKVFFLFIAGTIAFGLFVGLMALLFGGIAWWPVNNFLWTSNWQQLYAWGTLIFFLIVPLVGFIIWLIRRIINVRSRSNYMGWTFGSLWALGWVAAVMLAVSISKDFYRYSNVETAVEVVQPANNRMVVVVSEPELQYTGRFGWMNDDIDGWDMTDDTMRLSMVRFNIRKSSDDQYHVVLRRHSYGRSEAEAKDRAGKIRYAVYSRDSVLDLSSGYAIGRESKFRLQQVEVEIQVPAGKKISFDESVMTKLNPQNLRFKGSRHRKVTVNGRVVEDDHYDDYSFPYRTGVDYVMGLDGDLKDTEGNTVTSDGDDYRYDGKAVDSLRKKNDSLELKKSIEQKKRELKELEDQQNKQQQQPATGQETKAVEKQSDAVTGSFSPVLSMMKPSFNIG
ncbi:MAG: PspC domain-containing protein [Chitinophagaceae bacterium]